MNLVVLTTDTTHHRHFVRALARRHAPALVISETTAVRPPFDTHHAFEDERERYERQRWFAGGEGSLGDPWPLERVDSMNAPAAVDLLRRSRPDVVVVYGTRRLARAVIDVCPDAIVNLHGGDPESYRGLDSHLWAIYHGDFAGLVATLHRVNERLDEGDVIDTRPVSVERGLALHELRSRTTEVCIEIVDAALDAFLRRGHFHSRPQRRPGRYYSFMPAVLKGPCRARFERHTGAGS